MISRVLGITLVAAGLILAAVGTGAVMSSDEATNKSDHGEAVMAQQEYKSSCSMPTAELVQLAEAEKSSCSWSEAKVTKAADGKSCTYDKAQKTAEGHVVMTGSEKVAKGYSCSEEKAVKTADTGKACSYEGKAVKTAAKSCEKPCDQPCEEKAVKTAAEKKDCKSSCDKAKPATDKTAPSDQPEKVASEEESTKVSLAK